MLKRIKITELIACITYLILQFSLTGMSPLTLCERLAVWNRRQLVHDKVKQIKLFLVFL